MGEKKEKEQDLDTLGGGVGAGEREKHRTCIQSCSAPWTYQNWNFVTVKSQAFLLLKG